MIDVSKTCASNEVKVVWNQVGPKGDKGDTGPMGQQGLKGDKGDPGLGEFAHYGNRLANTDFLIEDTSQSFHRFHGALKFVGYTGSEELSTLTINSHSKN